MLLCLLTSLGGMSNVSTPLYPFAMLIVAPGSLPHSSPLLLQVERLAKVATLVPSVTCYTCRDQLVMPLRPDLIRIGPLAGEEFEVVKEQQLRLDRGQSDAADVCLGSNLNLRCLV